VAYEVPGLSWSNEQSGEDLTNYQYTFVAYDGNGNVVHNTTDGALCLGVVQNKPLSGRSVTIMSTGISRVAAGEAVTKGALVSSDATGRAAIADTGDKVLGTALSAASAAGEIISVLLIVGVGAAL
jgi:uncharacterized protein DUF2190